MKPIPLKNSKELDFFHKMYDVGALLTPLKKK